MSTVQNTMMKARGSRADDWLKAQVEAAKAAMPDAQDPARVPLPLVPLAQLQMLQSTLAHEASGYASRAVEAGAALPALANDPNAAQEAWALAGAAVQRWWSVQAQSVRDWVELGKEMGELKQARSVSNYLSMQINYTEQAQANVSSWQLNMAEWMDAVVVDTGWWLARKRAQARG